ncbi:MAG: hypothetical protein ACPGPR_05245 [Paracoccaceae bacterium]|jgi:hypothetical protein
MRQINQSIQKIDELLQDGMYETAEKIVTQLNSELSYNEENLYLMQLDDLHSLKDKIDNLSKLAEGLYVKEVAKVRTKRLARMLYACKDLTE